jgi:hypothetical protein
MFTRIINRLIKIIYRQCIQTKQLKANVQGNNLLLNLYRMWKAMGLLRTAKVETARCQINITRVTPSFKRMRLEQIFLIENSNLEKGRALRKRMEVKVLLPVTCLTISIFLSIPPLFTSNNLR